MQRSSKSIALALIGTGSAVLIGSALLLKGCGTEDEGGSWAEDGQPAEGQQAATGHRGGGGGGIFILPRVGGGFVGGGRGVGAPAPSARGGFGSTGSAGVGS